MLRVKIQVHTWKNNNGFLPKQLKKKEKKKKKKEKKGLLNPHTHVPAVSYGLSEET